MFCLYIAILATILSIILSFVPSFANSRDKEIDKKTCFICLVLTIIVVLLYIFILVIPYLNSKCDDSSCSGYGFEYIYFLILGATVFPTTALGFYVIKDKLSRTLGIVSILIGLLTFYVIYAPLLGWPWFI